MTIISHSRKFIFLKSEKTAGTSLLQSLGKHCGNKDIVCGTGRKYHSEYPDYSKNNEGFIQHMTSERIIREIQPRYKNWKEIWNSYFKFTSIRNPWDQHVSNYCWNYAKAGINNPIDKKKIAMPGDKNFKNLFKESINSQESCNWEKYYFYNNLPVADFYIRFEYLEEDFKHVCRKLDIKDASLPIMKRYKEREIGRFSYRKFYDKETRQLVYNKHINIIESFGYKFNDSSNVKNTIENVNKL